MQVSAGRVILQFRPAVQHLCAPMAQSFRLPLSGREQKRPFLTAQTPRGKHEGDKSGDQSAPDRFSAPVASISFNSLGEPVYGLPERPLTASVKYQFEQQKARENEADLDRMTAKPQGRRHDAYTDYLQRIAAGDTKTSWEAVQKRGMERITRTYHPIFQSSHENPLQTPQAPASPHPSQRPATALTQQVMADSAAAGILPVANSEGIQAVRSRAQDNVTSLDFWHDIHGSGEGSRFSAHADFDVKHDKAMAEESARADARARQRGEYSQKVHATRDLEQELSMDFPHGLPAGRLREARSRGMKVGGLGFGFPSSMTEQHTSIMRSTVKRPMSTTPFH